MLIDSHSHLNHENYINNIDQYIKECNEVNVKMFLCVGWDLKSSIDAVNIANKYNNVYAAVGVHPSDIKKMSEKDFNEIEKLISNPKVVAIGEIGLDYYWEKDINEKNKQKEYFVKFINLANKYNLPVVIHSRDAINDTYEILRNNKVNKGGVMHCYPGGKEYINRFVELDFYFGVGGVVTFNNAKTLKEAVKEMPLDRIVLETDSPYLTPVPFRGTLNHSKYLPYIAKEIANLCNISIEKVEENTCKNFYKLLNVEHNENKLK